MSLKTLITYLLLILTFFCNAQEEFISINFNIDEGLPSSQTYEIWEDSLGYIWITTDRGVVRYNGDKFETFTTKDGLANITNFRFHPTSKNTFWVNGLNRKFSHWDGETFTPFKFNHKLEDLQSKNNIWASIVKIHDNKIYFTIDNGEKGCPEHIYSIGKNDGVMEKNLLKEHIFSKGNISNQTEYSIGRCASNSKFTYGLIDSLLSTNHLKNKTIYTIFPDNLGNLWAGTNKGVYIFDQKGGRPTILCKDASVSSIYMTRNNSVWISTLNKGIFLFPNLSIKKLASNIQYSDRSFQQLISTDSSLYARTEGRVIVQLSNNISNDFSYEYSVDNSFIKINEAFSKLILSNKKIVYLLFSGFYISNYPNDKKFHKYKERTLSAIEDNNGHVWIGTSKNLYRKNIFDNSYTFDKIKIPFIEGEVRVNKISKAKDHLWFGTLSNGLLFYKNDKFHSINNNILLSKNIHSICSENDSTLWIATNKGLNKLIYQTKSDSAFIKEVYSYNSTIGILSNYILDVTMWNNQLYLATNKGICYFNPENIKLDKNAPIIQIKKILVNSQHKTDLKNLKYNQNNIEIKYSGISTNRLPSDKNAYRYRMVSNNWIYTNTNSVHFTKITPGSYKFEVQYRNLNNKWSSSSYVSFRIIPHFIQTRLFIVLITISILIIVFLIYNSKVKAIKLRTQKEIAYQNIELSNLRRQFNPHFIFNGLNTIQSYIFSDKPRQANEYLGQLSHLIRKGLEYSKKDIISLNSEIEFVTTYLTLERKRFIGKFDFQIEIEAGLDQKKIFVPPMLTQPIIENSIKHAFKKKKICGIIKIIYSLEDKATLKIIIEDDGDGFDVNNINMTKKHRSMGLSLIKEQIDILNKKFKNPRGSVSINSILNKGTKVIMLVALKNPKL